MGCVSSRRDINDIHPNIFQVMNVDELGQHVTPGQLEVTESELVLYLRGKPPKIWPLRCLRRYGFVGEMFSFESGRRCPTGPGVYAFQCRRADQLFNLLQQNTQLRSLNEDFVLASVDLSIPVVSSGPPVSSRQPNDQSYLDRAVLPRSQISRLSRHVSVTSNGPVSPPPASSPTPSSFESAAVSEFNNNKRIQHSYSNTLPVLEDESNPSSTVQPYMNLDPTSSPTLSSNSEPYAQLNMDSEAEYGHLYVNVTPGESSTVASIATTQKNILEPPLLLECDEEKEEPCYANLNPGEIETTHLNVRLPQSTNILPVPTEVTRTMNYIVLDLGSKSNTDATGAVSTGVLPPDSPRKPAESYATIDFTKTTALSHSVNPGLEDNEGTRQTRHNSTIGELAPIIARHSTSLSD